MQARERRPSIDFALLVDPALNVGCLTRLRCTRKVDGLHSHRPFTFWHSTLPSAMRRILLEGTHSDKCRSQFLHKCSSQAADRPSLAAKVFHCRGYSRFLTAHAHVHSVGDISTGYPQLNKGDLGKLREARRAISGDFLGPGFHRAKCWMRVQQTGECRQLQQQVVLPLSTASNE
jgi:hypothetical protein